MIQKILFFYASLLKQQILWMPSDPNRFIFISSIVRYPNPTKKKLLYLFFGENIKLASFCFDLNNVNRHRFVQRTFNYCSKNFHGRHFFNIISNIRSWFSIDFLNPHLNKTNPPWWYHPVEIIASAYLLHFHLSYDFTQFWK